VKLGVFVRVFVAVAVAVGVLVYVAVFVCVGVNVFVCVFVNVRVNVAVGGGFPLRMHNSSMYKTRFVYAFPCVWNWIADNCDSAASTVIAGPQPTCEKSPFSTVIACHDVVVVKLNP